MKTGICTVYISESPGTSSETAVIPSSPGLSVFKANMSDSVVGATSDTGSTGTTSTGAASGEPPKSPSSLLFSSSILSSGFEIPSDIPSVFSALLMLPKLV